MLRCNFPFCETKDVVLAVEHPGTFSGQYETVGLPFQNEPPLALMAPFNGLLDQRILSVKGESEDCRGWGAAEASDRRDRAARNFIARVSFSQYSAQETNAQLQQRWLHSSFYIFGRSALPARLKDPEKTPRHTPRQLQAMRS